MTDAGCLYICLFSLHSPSEGLQGVSQQPWSFNRSRLEAILPLEGNVILRSSQTYDGCVLWNYSPRRSRQGAR